jgi:dUTP pyrophosphatase
MVPKYLQPIIEVALDHPNLMPTRAHPSDAGADLKTKDTVWLQPLKRTLVSTGVRVSIPIGHVGLLVPRSSLSKYEIILSNSVGVIDSDYRGELLVALTYIGSNEHGTSIASNERIAQLLVVPIILPEFTEVNALKETVRGEKGFGSTGK